MKTKTNRRGAWRSLGALAVAAFLMGASTAPATRPRLPHAASDMETARGPAAVAIKDALLKAAPTAPMPRYDYGTAVAAEFSGVLSSANADARLNTVIVLAELRTLSCEGPLIAALKNTDASVRYWGAKGLAPIAPAVKLVSSTRVVKALNDALTVETSPQVKAQITETLKAY